MLSDGKTKLTHRSTPLIHGKTKLTHGRTPLIHGKTKLTHGKTKKTSWSAACQRLLFAFQMVCRVTVTQCSLGNRCSLSRAHDVLQLLWFVSRSKCQLLQRLWKRYIS